MSSLQPRIVSFTTISTDLITQLSELDQLRERVREAQLAAQRRHHIKGRKRPRLPGGVEFGRERVTPLR